MTAAGSTQGGRRSSVAVSVVAVLLGLGVLLAVALYARANYRSVPPSVHHGAASNPGRIAPWMTIGFVSRAYRVPEPVLLRALGISAAQADHHSLAGIARAQHMSTAQVLLRVRAAIHDYRMSAASTPVPRRTAQ